MAKIKRALISVFDKTGLIPFARELHKQKVEILSTGGTLKELQKAGVPARSVSEVTGFPEILEGRVKTLHPKIHGGLLYRRGKSVHEKEISEHAILPIDMVVVNLYPFREVIQKKDVPLEEAVENIDIGGPTMLRSAAKNYESVTVVTDPKDYGAVLQELEKNGGKISEKTRAHLAQKVFEETSSYDRLIADYLRKGGDHGTEGGPLPVPERLNVVYEKAEVLRYGENPHQRGVLYRRTGRPRFDFKIHHGKELSFNNLLDFEAAVDTLREFDEIAACVIKHTNPCGIAEGKTLEEAIEKAVDSDSLSAFGGIVGVNRPFNLKSAERLYELLRFVEIIVAPKFRPEALRLFQERKNVRLLEIGKITEGGPWDLRFTKFGILLQDRDRPIPSYEEELRRKLRWVTKTKFGKEVVDELLFAWKCAKRVRSNAIVITHNRQTLGIGAGQMSRIDSVEIACRKASFRAEGSVMASDAFFPMTDSIETVQKAGVWAIIQPGGSIRDAEVIAACDKAGIGMVFTGERHFRH